MKLYAPSTIKEIKDKYGFRLSKSLGQNFLTDKNIIDRIIEGSGIGREDTVVEIGPGIGVITREAAAIAKKVFAIEIDKNLMPILNETLGEFDNIEVINDDVLKVDINKLTEGTEKENVKIIGNLPYYITTPIIMGLLENHTKAKSITVMMQKEVADRTKAAAGSKVYGAISVAVQYYCTVTEIAKVSRSAFVPQPNVDSTVLRLDMRMEPPVSLIDRDLFFACIKAGFGQRRKTLANSLGNIENMDKTSVTEILKEVGIDPGRRAETLKIEEFAAISNAIAEKKQSKEN